MTDRVPDGRRPTEVEVVVFEVGGIRYGILVSCARELVRAPSLVPLPKAPAIVEGVANLHGAVVPVLDIRRRFRLPAKPPAPSDHLVVARANGRLVALRVDRVLELAQVDADEIVDAKEITTGADYVAGVAKLPDGLVLIHDLKTFLDRAEAEGLDDALAGGRVATSS